MKDGLSHYGIFFRIIAPLSTAIAVTLPVAFFFANRNSYLWPLIVTQKRELWVIQIAIANLGSNFVSLKSNQFRFFSVTSRPSPRSESRRQRCYDEELTV